MIELTIKECELVGGAGWIVYLLPIALGLVTGGPVGVGLAIGGIIATTGASNLEHLHRHGSTPSFGDMVGNPGSNKGGGR
jgi:hypothetical protein